MAKLRDLTPDASNANRGTERGRYALETSLRKYGAGRSILIDRHGRIIAGNKTAETAADVGIDDVIVVQTDGRQLVAVQRTDLDLDSKEARELAYADNRVAELDLSFDPEQLLADLQAGVDLAQFWRQDELDELLADLTPKVTGDTEPQVDRAEELRQLWNVQPGQLWQLGEQRLVCGDCTDAATVERVMGGEKIDCIVTDPPYGVDYDGGTVVREKLEGDKTPQLYFPALQCWLPFCNAHVALYLWYADGDQAVAQAVAQAGWLVRRNLIWNKNQAQYGALSQQYHQKHEPFLYCHIKGKSPYWAGDATEVTVWDIARESVNDLHPTQKPPALFERAMRNSSKQGDCVFDGFSGSGTTIIACENLGRRCRAVEISPAYVAVALQRWADHTQRAPVLIG